MNNYAVTKIMSDCQVKVNAGYKQEINCGDIVNLQTNNGRTEEGIVLKVSRNSCTVESNKYNSYTCESFVGVTVGSTSGTTCSDINMGLTPFSNVNIGVKATFIRLGDILNKR